MTLVLLHDLAVALEDRFDHLLEVINEILQDRQVTKVNTLMDETVSESVLTVHEVEDLRL